MRLIEIPELFFTASTSFHAEYVSYWLRTPNKTYHKSTLHIIMVAKGTRWTLSIYYQNGWDLTQIIFKFLEDISPLCGTTDTHVLDFRCCLLWVSKPGWIPRFISGVTPAHLFDPRTCTLTSTDIHTWPLHICGAIFNKHALPGEW